MLRPALLALALVTTTSACATNRQAAHTAIAVGTTSMALGGWMVFEGETCRQEYEDQCLGPAIAEHVLGMPMLGLGLLLDGVGFLMLQADHEDQ